MQRLSDFASRGIPTPPGSGRPFGIYYTSLILTYLRNGMGPSLSTPRLLPPVLSSNSGTTLVTGVLSPPPSMTSWCSIYLAFTVSLSVTVVVMGPFPKTFNSSMRTGFRQRFTVLQRHSPLIFSTSSTSFRIRTSAIRMTSTMQSLNARMLLG